MSRSDKIIDGKKVCTKCLINKPIEDFLFVKGRGRYKSRCRVCTTEYVKKWMSDNVEKTKTSKKKYKSKIVEQNREKRQLKKETIAKEKEMKKFLKEEEKRLKEVERKNEIERRRIERINKSIEYRNSDEFKEKKNEKTRRKEKRRMANPLHNFKKKLRNCVRNSFTRNGYSKEARAHSILGADWDVVRKHFEDRFKEGMTWDNYGEWHIDHIIPISLARNKDDVIKLNHYTNLQPLWGYENMGKSNKIIVNGYSPQVYESFSIFIDWKFLF